MSKTYDELPDTITPEDYADWRGIGIEYARTYFHTQGFPRLKNAGNRLIADKRAVLMFDLKLDNKDFVNFINKSNTNTFSFDSEQTFTITIRRI